MIMSIKKIYHELCLIAEQLQIKVIQGKGNFKGGACLVKEKSIIVINNNYPFESRVRSLGLSLLGFNLDNIQIDQKIEKFLINIKHEKELNE